MDKDHVLDKLIILGGMLIIFSLIAYLFVVTLTPLTAGGKELATMIVGAISPIIMGITGYYWGAAKTNKDRDKALQQMADKIPPPGAVTTTEPVIVAPINSPDNETNT